MEKVTVFLSDWQVLFREGIHFTLSGEEDIEVIGETTSSEEAMAFIEQKPPRIVVLNAEHGRLTGIEATGRIKQTLPEVSVILVMENEDEEIFYFALKSGASACVTKDIDPGDLIDIINEVVQGANPISRALLRPEIAKRALDDFERFSSIGGSLADMMARLTPREAEILRYLAGGGTLDQAATSLSLAEDVISHELEIILYKLVTNEQHRKLIIVGQNSPAVTQGSNGGSNGDYITKSEFDTFKNSLLERFQSLMSELKLGGGSM
ncbi:MAG: response regulator transcription factor [Dehalococcoidales bacterium]|jgi:DNA-binding NarL/FixJ family response regulator